MFIQPFIQTQIKENIKAPRHWPLCGEFTGDQWIPAQMASNAENVSIWWRHHYMRTFFWPFVMGIYWSPVESPHKWSVIQSSDSVNLNKLLNEESTGPWFNIPCRSCNVTLLWQWQIKNWIVWCELRQIICGSILIANHLPATCHYDLYGDFFGWSWHQRRRHNNTSQAAQIFIETERWSSHQRRR